MAFQGMFRRHNKFVVVKPVHLTANETLEVGTVIDMKKGNIRWFQLRLWFKRRRIGTEGSEWVKQIIAGARSPEGAAISTKRDIENLAKTLSAVAVQKAEDNPPLIGLETEEGAKELADVKVDKAPDSTVEPSNEQEPASTEPELTAEEKKEKQRLAKNARERAKRAAKAAAKNK